MFRLTPPALLLLVASCGPAPVTETKVEGSLGGASFAPKFALYRQGQDAEDKENRVVVFLSNREDACSRLVQHQNVSVLRDESGEREPSLMLVMDGKALLWSDRRDFEKGYNGAADPGAPAACRNAGSSDAGTDAGTPAAVNCEPAFILLDGGFARLDRVDDFTKPGSTATGEFEAVLDSNERISGTFVATPCAALDASCAALPGPLFSGLLGLAVLLRARSRRRSC